MLFVGIILGVLLVIMGYDLKNECEDPDCKNCPFPQCTKSKHLY